MLNLLLKGLAVIAGGVAGYFIGKAISEYFEKAKDWFSSVWNKLTKVYRGAGVFVRYGNRLFKRLIVQFADEKIEEYEEHGDNGIEFDPDDLREDMKKKLFEDDFIVAYVFE